MTSTTRSSTTSTTGLARHRAAPAVSAFAALRDRAGLGGGGRPVVGHRRAAVAGVALATAAVGTGLLGPALVGGDAGGADRAEDREPTRGLLPATTLELVSGRTLDPSRAREGGTRRTAGAAPAGRAEAPAGSTDDAAASDATPAAPGAPGGPDTPGVRDLSSDGAGQPGQTGSTDDTDGGDSDDALLGGTVDTVVQATAPLRTQLPPPLGDVADGTGTVVEETVAGPLAGIVP